MTRSPIPLFVCLCLAVTLAGRASAQSFGYGPKGGISLTTQKFDQKQSLLAPSSEIGWIAGGLIRQNLFWSIQLQVEGLYSQRRTSFSDIVTDTLRYVEVPILLRYPVFGPPSWRVHVVGGAVVSHLLEAREKVGTETSGAGDDITDKLEPNETAASIGADVQFKRRWVADFRYLYGFSEVYRNAGPLFVAKQRAMQITVSYRFK
jgi:Outer membrane protein beta-barrel domain